MKKLGFTVLMSLYGGEKATYLDECFNSLHIQELIPPEIILIIDGPISKELNDVVSFWTNKLNLKIYPLKENVGLTKALNFGLEKCSHELVARMDTDDICEPDRFLIQLDFMESNYNVDICGSYAQNISENGTLLEIRKVPVEFRNIKKYIWTNPLIHPSVIFRKSKIIKIGSYNVNAPHRHDDYELWIRAIDSGLIFENIPKTLIRYRVPDVLFQKTSFTDKVNTFRVGYKAVWNYDRRFISILGLAYPIVRMVLPEFMMKAAHNIAKKVDPRHL
jgi:glycosyltransferase involved in cell wall biosynthesis